MRKATPPTGEDAIDLTTYSFYLRDVLGLSANTVTYHLHHVKRLLAYLQAQNVRLPDLTKETVQRCITDTRVTAKSERLFLLACKYYCHYLEELGEESCTLFDGLKAAKQLPRQHTFYTPEEIERLLAQPDTSTLLGLRDRTILQLFYDTGIRNTELRQLRVKDVDIPQRMIRVFGKGQKERLIPLNPQIIDWLQAWSMRRPELLNGENSPCLFPGRMRRVNSDERMLSSNGVWGIVKRHAKTAGLDKGVTAHSLRHAFASHMLENGANLRVVQLLLGHVNLETTQIYLQLRNSHLKALHQRFHPRG